MPTNYKGEKRPLKDGEGSPVGVKGKWAHEGIRALAAVPGSAHCLFSSSRG